MAADNKTSHLKFYTQHIINCMKSDVNQIFSIVLKIADNVIKKKLMILE